MSDAPSTTTGTEALAAMFARARAENRAAFLPYFPIGYPTRAASVEAIVAPSRKDSSQESGVT